MGCARAALLSLLVAGVGCRDDHARDARPAADEAVSKVTPSYLDRQASFQRGAPANPTGVYWEGDRLWVWSDRHSLQRSYARRSGRYVEGDSRRGPAATERCVVGRARLRGTTFCVGRLQNGGLLAFATGDVAPRRFGQLPARGGFLDLVLLHTLGLVGVLDGVEQSLRLLDRSGAEVARHPLPASSYRIGAAGEDRVFVLSGGAPALTVLQVEATGDTRVLGALPRTAPLRDACHDPARGLLWITGPEDQRVRRHRGPIEHLGSEISALDAAALARGAFVVRARFDLQAHGLADPTRLVAVEAGVLVSLTGSDRLAWLRPRPPGAGFDLRVIESGLAPGGLADGDAGLAVATRLDDRLHVFRDLLADKPVATDVIVLDAEPRAAPADVGERLFYGALLWSQSRERPYTCNSCHWDTGSDRRRHPGLRERRLEQTRPLGGVGALSPVFTPGQARTLDVAVDGLVRILDDRYFRDRGFVEEPLEVTVKGGTRVRLDPTEKRRALAAFLRGLPVEPGPYLRSEAPELVAASERGAALFVRDCADCHAPRFSSGAAASGAGLLVALREQPGVLGGDGFAHTGAGPSFTDVGNRISPLMNLSRGGPYFASGMAARLRDVGLGFTRARPGVHSGTGARAYDTHEVDALTAFLHCL